MKKNRKKKKSVAPYMAFVMVLCLVVVCIGIGLTFFLSRSDIQNEKTEITNNVEEVSHIEEKSTSSDNPVYKEKDEDRSVSDLVSIMSDGSEENDVKTEKNKRALEIVSHMTLEEKVAQLFFITPESLTGVDTVVRFGDISEDALKKYPVGGLIYFKSSLESVEQTVDMLESTQSFYVDMQKDSLPIFLGVDEEGGRVTRVGGNPGFPYEKVDSMRAIASSGNPMDAKQTADYIGDYLELLGFNVDFAPVADVLTNSANQVIGDRSFGSNPALVSEMARYYEEGLSEHGIFAVYKHFPGHGSTIEDSHKGYAYIDKTIDQLLEEDIVPFRDAIDNGADFIMVGHISMPEATEGKNIPASLSEYFVTELLRNSLGYDGVVITDALGMGAISQNYTSGEASVMAIEAGCDMLLMASEFKESYEAVLDAVNSGRIEEDRLDESVSRIVRVKLKLLDDFK